MSTRENIRLIARASLHHPQFCITEDFKNLKGTFCSALLRIFKILKEAFCWSIPNLGQATHRLCLLLPNNKAAHTI